MCELSVSSRKKKGGISVVVMSKGLIRVNEGQWTNDVYFSLNKELIYCKWCLGDHITQRSVSLSSACVYRCLVYFYFFIFYLK